MLAHIDMPLTRAQKQSICAQLKLERASVVARLFGISRSRVYQLRKEDPASWTTNEYGPPGQRIPRLVFKTKNAHLNSATLQRRIAQSSKSFALLAKTHNTTVYAVTRIHSHWACLESSGKPRGSQRSRPNGLKSEAPSTPEQLAERLARTRSTTRLWQKRWQANNPELARERNSAAYERRKENHRAYMREYYQKHRDQCLTQNREWKKANPHKAAQYKVTWAERNPDKVKAKSERQRDRRRDSRSTFGI